MHVAVFKRTQENENLPEKLSQPLPRTSSTPQVHKQHSWLNHYIRNKTARVKIKPSLHELRVEKEVFEDYLVKIFWPRTTSCPREPEADSWGEDCPPLSLRECASANRGEYPKWPVENSRVKALFFSRSKRRPLPFERSLRMAVKTR